MPTYMKCEWRLDSLSSIKLEQFYKVDLGGNAWFIMDIHTPIGLIPHNVRFIDSPFENSRLVSSGIWAYSATIEIKARAKITEDEYFILLNFGSYADFLLAADQIHQAVHYDYPAAVSKNIWTYGEVNEVGETAKYGMLLGTYASNHLFSGSKVRYSFDVDLALGSFVFRAGSSYTSTIRSSGSYDGVLDLTFIDSTNQLLFQNREDRSILKINNIDIRLER